MENKLADGGSSELLFGAAYYAEYMPYDRVSEDLTMMKQAGMNVIRIAESTWSTLEPTEGSFCFQYIDQVLQEAERKGLKVIIGTPTYAVPAWLVKKDPEVMVMTKNGRALYGPRQKMDLMNPTFRFCAERMIRTLIAHVAEHPQVIGYQIDNETKHYDTSSEPVQRLFVSHLKSRFGTTEALNEAYGLAYWSNSIHSWEDIPDLRGTIHGGLAGEFQWFQRKLAADYLKWQAELVAEYKKESQFITHNFDFEWKKFGAAIAQDGYSYGLQPGINHAQAAEALTLIGTDIYHPSQDLLTGAEIAYCGDSIRSLKSENYLVLECQAQAFKQWTPYPGQLTLQAYSHLASGALGLMYWNWHSIHNGFETYWKGVLSHDLLPNEVYREAVQIGAEWNRIGSSLSIHKKNQIALVVDNRSLDAFTWFPIDSELTYNDVVRYLYDSLYEMNLECDIVDVKKLDPAQYRMIITPALYCAEEPLLLKLEDFVKAGGVLVSSFKSFVADEKVTVWHDTQPHLLSKCFGMSYQQFADPGRATLKGRKVEYFAELLLPDTAVSLGNYEHKYWGRYAAITANDFGKGKAYYLGCYTEKETLKELYRQAAAAAGIPLPLLNWPLILRSGRNKEGEMIYYLLNYSEKEQTIAIPWKQVRELRKGETCREGEVYCLKDWGVAVFKESL